jgi:hypothetical protein
MTSSNIDYCLKIGASAFQNCDQDIINNKSFKQSDRHSEKIFKGNAKQIFLNEKQETVRL